MERELGLLLQDRVGTAVDRHQGHASSLDRGRVRCGITNASDELCRVSDWTMRSLSVAPAEAVDAGEALWAVEEGVTLPA